MAKHKLEEQHSLNIVGELNTEDMQITIEEYGNFELKKLLQSFDGSTVAISVRKKTDSIE